MATSCSLPTYTSNGTFSSAKAIKSSRTFMSSSTNLSIKSLVGFNLSGCSSTKNALRWTLHGKHGVRVHSRAAGIAKAHSFPNGDKFQLDDVIEAQQFDRDTLTAIFEVAREMEKIEKNSPGSQILKGYLMATLFYEPSTRTRLSFESAMKRLGGEVLTTENAREFSSAAKGETLEGKS